MRIVEDGRGEKHIVDSPETTAFNRGIIDAVGWVVAVWFVTFPPFFVGAILNAYLPVRPHEFDWTMRLYYLPAMAVSAAVGCYKLLKL
jgi:hypothetical protein